MAANPIPDDKRLLQEELLALRRRLARSDAARQEAEQLLEHKARDLASALNLIKESEEELRRRVDRQSQILVRAQDLANMATFHIDQDHQLHGSSNLANVLGSKIPVLRLDQIVAMVHPFDPLDIGKIRDIGEQGGFIGKEMTADVRFLDHQGETRWLRWTVTQQEATQKDARITYGAVRDISAERKADRHQRALRIIADRRRRQTEKLSAELGDQSITLANRVHELERLGGELEKAKTSAEQADRAKSRFLAMMSHDIRTPMNAMLAVLELLGISELDERQRSLVSVAQSSGDQLLFLLADIIEYARSDGWKLELQNASFDVEDFAQKAADGWQQLAKKKGLSIECQINIADTDPVSTDPVRLRQVVDNFLSNAIKYSDKGAIEMTVDVTQEGDSGRLAIAVSDQGRGISPDLKASLFDDFERGLEAMDDDIQGSGLGLAICRRIAEAMGGAVGVESDGQTGSRFWIDIPVRRDGSAKKHLPGPAEIKQQQLSIDGRRPKFLVAEDVEANRIVLISFLEELDCDYVAVTNGQEAVDALRSQSFDGILMDISMPVMDGMAATRLIRSGQDQAQIPICGVTAFAAEEDRQDMRAAGMDDIVTKPIGLAPLYTALAHLCARADGDSLVAEPLLDSQKLQDQFLTISASRRGQLAKALIQDLTQWFDRFKTSCRDNDVQKLSVSHHALKGICSGFGAQPLLRHLDGLRDRVEAGETADLNAAQQVFEDSLKEIKAQQADWMG